ncbi:MAG: hypothetical protein E6J90_49735 [Deltaproteobacteria bacterium]|nr:MAG: hypothetical protein E6J90_49735 [Deltaproteobacteria bacterium]TMQ15670.1 MAG: hypothetical protein E6J91_13105 [Deltaproteobacteria bacterium]
MTEPRPRARWWTAVAVAVAALAGCRRDPEVRARGPSPPGGDGHQLHSAGPAMTITADQLRAWSEQLCTLPPIDFAAALAALGIAGSIVSQTADFATVEPPPAGASRLGLTLENLGKNRGYLGTLEVTLGGAGVTRGELDQRFGAGNLLPRVDYDRPFVVNYRVELAGAPYRCTVSASFADEPTAASTAVQISLRRDVVRSPEPARSGR